MEAAMDTEDRSTRFLRRIDAYLPRLPDNRARRRFLDRQIAGWEHLYARFLVSAGASEPSICPADPPQAADFLLTITGLARRRGAIPAEDRCQMTDHRSAESIRPPSPLIRSPSSGVRPPASDIRPAMLSLLVAADQRCPAIIGQAHLLYYCGLDGSCMGAEAKLRQLKRDTQDLLDAIAGAEAAVKARYKTADHGRRTTDD
jgi:hypothetical protein